MLANVKNQRVIIICIFIIVFGVKVGNGNTASSERVSRKDVNFLPCGVNLGNTNENSRCCRAAIVVVNFYFLSVADIAFSWSRAFNCVTITVIIDKIYIVAIAKC